MKLLNPIPNSILKKWPIGNIYQGFGENMNLYQQRIGTMGHTGIDISGLNYHGKPVVATHDGTVINVYYRADLGGQMVNIHSDIDEKGESYQTVYGHLIKDSQKVKINDRVRAGQEIGLCGNSGFVISGGTPYWGDAPGQLGTHLHFGVWLFKDGKVKYPDNGFKGCVDPLYYLTGDLSGYQTVITNLATMVRDILARFKK